MGAAESTFHVDLLIALLLVACAVAIAVKWVRLPYSIALVITGLAIGVLHLLPPVEMTPELILVVFLPALLFEAAWNLELPALKANWLPITVLATVGLLISMAVVAGIMHGGAGFGLGAAFLFGAMISATDPISVIALFRKLGIHPRLTMLLEGESLFNDGTAVVFFKLVLASIVSASVFSVSATIGSFIIVVAGGTLVGLVTGYAASRITSYFDDHLLEITLTTVVAYGSFLIAEQLHVSSVIAVVLAGIVLGNYGSRSGMSPTTRIAVNSFWEYAAFVVNSLVFLLIGLQVKFDLLQKYVVPIAIGILAIVAARACAVYLLCPLLASKTRPIPWNWRHLLFWGGLRGSLCMALALSLPLDFPEREAFIITTFGVVLFTLVVPGLTIEPLVRLLRMLPERTKQEEYLTLKTRLILEGAAAELVDELEKRRQLSGVAAERLKLENRLQREALVGQISELHLSDASIQALELSEAKFRLLEAKKDQLNGLLRSGAIPEAVACDLRAELDSELYSLAEHQGETPV